MDNRGSGARARGVSEVKYSHAKMVSRAAAPPAATSTWRSVYLAVAVVTFSAVAVGGAAIFFITT